MAASAFDSAKATAASAEEFASMFDWRITSAASESASLASTSA